MKPLWRVTIVPVGQVSPRDIRADECRMSLDESLIFADRIEDAHPYCEKVLKARFAPGQWVMVEQIYEDGESENAANYAYKELEKDD